MQKLGRRILFWTLVALFLIIAPAVVLNAKGYRFDLKRAVFVHSGTISLKTNPQEINLSINGENATAQKLNRINGSVNIPGLIPADYNLSISAPGFQTWNKKTDVHSGLANEFWNILLVRNEYEKTEYPTAKIGKFFLSPKSENIIYTEPQDTGVLTKIISIKNPQVQAEFAFPDWQLAPDERQENIEWSPKEDYLSIPLKKLTTENTPIVLSKNTVISEKKAEFSYFIADPAAKTSFNLNEFIGKSDIKNVRWDPKDKNYLFYMSDDSLYRANIKDSKDSTLISDNVSGFDLSEERVYFSKMPNELIYKTGLDGKGEREQLTQSFPGDIPAPIEKIIVYDDLRIVFIDQRKNLFVYNRGEFDTYFKKLSDNVEGMHFSDDGKKLLYWTKNEISVYFLRQWTVQPIRNENELQNITRYSEEVKNVQWFKDYEHILFTIGSQTKIIELDGRDQRNSMDVCKSSLPAPFVIYSPSLEKLFFTDQKDSASILNSINFPEKIPLLGIL